MRLYPMLYAVLCYNDEATVFSWTKEEDDAVMGRLNVVHEKWEKAGKLKPSLRLLPTSAATTLRKKDNEVLDGPYAETKEQLLGFYIIEVDNLEEGLVFRARADGGQSRRRLRTAPDHALQSGHP
jgi:hypothetical protein